MLSGFRKQAGNVCAIMFQEGNEFQFSRSFSGSGIRKTLDSIDIETSNLSDRSWRNKPTCIISKNNFNIYIDCIFSTCRWFSSKTTEYGQRNEKIARQQYDRRDTGNQCCQGADHHYIGTTADGIKNWTTIEIKCLFWAENMTVVEYCMCYIILKAWFVVKPEEGVRTRFLNKPEWGQLKPGG